MKKFEKLSLTKFQDAIIANTEILSGGAVEGRTKCRTTYQTQEIISEKDKVGVRVDWEWETTRD